MSDITIRYTVDLGAATESFVLRLDPRTLELKDRKQEELPAWTALEFQQCPNCPLRADAHPHCPAAVSLTDVMAGVGRVLSHQRVRVEASTEERTVTAETSAQVAVTSLIGLLMAVSGCPNTAHFRPMARFHLPFASPLETVYRVTSMYRLAQYFVGKAGGAQDTDFAGLLQIYERVNIVNRAFAERLRAASELDAALNAIVALDMHTMVMPMAIDDSLADLRDLFAPYLLEDDEVRSGAVERARPSEQ
jgi:hypothetical protein